MIVPTDDLKTAEVFSNLFAINPKNYKDIKSNIKKDGFRDCFPIIVWQGTGVIVDGHTRLKACQELGVPYVNAEYIHFDSELEAVEFAIKTQTNRRNLTDSEMYECKDKLDLLRKTHGGDHGATSRLASRKSSQETAKALGCGSRKVEQMRTIQDHADEETIQAVKDGNMSINKAYNETQAKRKVQAKEAEPVDDTKFVEYDEEEEFEAKLLEYSANLSKALKDKGLTHEEFAFVVNNMSYD
tara:strand:+ start:2990 stop:3715 length:726 start_codon:yes stop_codon:yes gene_type:complete